MTEIVSSPARQRSSAWRVASAGAMTWISRPEVSWSFRYAWTFFSSSASWARFSSSQKTAGAPVARARSTASFTQSGTATSLVWQARKRSPFSTGELHQHGPVRRSTTCTVPAAGASKVLSCEPYSSAFLAMSPTFATLPIVRGSKRPGQTAVVDRLVVDARVAAVGDDGLGVGGLAVGPPHLPAVADHRRHRGVDDDVAGHVQVGDAAVAVDHRQRRPLGVQVLQPGLDLGPHRVGQLAHPGVQVADAVVRLEAGGGQGVARASPAPGRRRPPPRGRR